MCIHSILCHLAHLRQKCKKPKNGFLSMISMGLDKAVSASHDKTSLASWVTTCMIWPCQPKPAPVTARYSLCALRFVIRKLICYPLL